MIIPPNIETFIETIVKIIPIQRLPIWNRFTGSTV